MRSYRTSKRRVIIGIIVAIVLIAAFGLFMYLIEHHGLLDEQFGDTGEWGRDDLEIQLDDKLYTSDDDIDTYLMIGLDSGGEDKGEGYNGELADFLVLLIADNTTKRYAFYQLDRNSMVDMRIPDYKNGVDEYATQQLCLAHWYGLDADERNKNTVEAVSTLLGGLVPNNYYVLNMEDIGKVNNAIGGVTVTIEQDMTNEDPAFTEGATVKLDDKQAEKFVRARMSVGDGTNKSRMSRQKQYMQKAYEIVYGHLAEEPEYVNDLADRLHGVVEIGENSDKMSKLTNQIVNFENVGTIQFDGESKVGETQEDGAEYEEFYVDENSVAECLGMVINLRELTEEEADKDDE